MGNVILSGIGIIGFLVRLRVASSGISKGKGTAVKTALQIFAMFARIMK